MDEEIIELYGGTVTIRFTEANHAYWLTHLNGKKLPRMKRLTGVTTLIDIVDKSKALIPWAVDTAVEFIRENQALLNDKNIDSNEIFEQARNQPDEQKNRAADIGTGIHAWIEAHINKQNPEMPSDPNVLKGVMSFVEWVETNKVKLLWTERMVYSKKYGYVGTADLGVKIGAGVLKGKTLMGDVKTTNGLYAGVRLQTSAYLEAIVEESKEKYDGRIAIRISKESEEEYIVRMEKKQARGKLKNGIPPYQIFEAVYLDENSTDRKEDFAAFINAMKLRTWNKDAERAMWQRNR